MNTREAHQPRWSATIPNLTIGIDVGDRTSELCEVDGEGRVIQRRKVATTPEAVKRLLSGAGSARVVLEAGSHSPWISRLAKQLGHEVIVANPTELYGKKRRRKKNDRIDAEELARRGRADPSLLYPIEHRSEAVQADLAVLQARDVAVQVRSKLIHHVRGSVKPFGVRLPACSAESFARKAAECLPEALQSALVPLLDQIASLSATIHDYDRRVDAVAAKYPQTTLLRQVSGVGALTAAAYVLVIENPERFPRSRAVGHYLGLCPRLDDSGEWQPQLPISKAGDEFMRRLLVGCAHYILGPFGPDTDLRRWGLTLMARGGKNAKKRAVVAVARKLSVLLLRLWVTAEVYEPLRQARLAEERRPAASALPVSVESQVA
jgi:transposase